MGEAIRNNTENQNNETDWATVDFPEFDQGAAERAKNGWSLVERRGDDSDEYDDRSDEYDDEPDEYGADLVANGSPAFGSIAAKRARNGWKLIGREDDKPNGAGSKANKRPVIDPEAVRLARREQNMRNGYFGPDGQIEISKQKALDHFKNAAIEQATGYKTSENESVKSEINEAKQELQEARRIRLEEEAAERIRQNNIAEYKKYHPNAVEDVEKAHYMAEVGDKLETEAAKAKQEAIAYFNDVGYTLDGKYRFSEHDGYPMTPEEQVEIFDRNIQESNQARARAHDFEDKAGAFYDRVEKAAWGSLDERYDETEGDDRVA